MVLQIVSPKEFGERLQWLRRQTTYTAEKLSLAIGTDKTKISYVERGKPANVDAQLAARIASELAGEGQLVNDEEKLFAFLMGLRDDTGEVLANQFEESDRRGYLLKVA